jgi:chemotaxis protein methyltransferase CheR
MSIAQPHFSYLRELVRKHSAIVIDADKDYLVDGRLSPLVDREGLKSIDDLIKSLVCLPFGTLHQNVVDAMTNNETWFFRDFQPFDALKREILPELMARNSATRKISIWSAACSAGQEPYSLAMCLREYFDQPGWNYSILASDLAEHILERSRRGCYSQMEVSRGLPALLLAKYFQSKGVAWELKPEIREMVTFRQINLISSWPYMPPVDVMLLRNVLIYFDVDTKKAILKKARSVLKPNGYLLLGGAESTLNLDNSFERIAFGTSAYYRLRSG